MELLPLKTKQDFQNDSEYILYCKKRYRQRVNYEYRERQKLKAVKASTPPLRKISSD